MVVIVPSSDAGSAIVDLDTLLSSAEEVLGRAPFGTAYTLAVSEVNSRLRVREMLQERTGGITLPDDFLEMETLSVNGAIYTPATTPLATDGTFVVHNDSVTLCPEETTNIFMRYFAKVDILEAGETNAVLSRYPDVFLYGILAQHAALARDADGKASWGPLFLNAIEEANKTDIMARQSSIPMMPRPRATA